MELKISPFDCRGEITAPPSKSEAQRLIVCAALSKGQTTVENISFSDDVNETLNCIESIGARAERCGNDVSITGVTAPPDEIDLKIQKCGFAARVFPSVALTLSDKVRVLLGEELQKRPMKPLDDCLTAIGITKIGDAYFGELKRGEYTIDGSASSQFTSGLLFAAANIGGNCTITVDDEVSGDYVAMTVAALAKFGVCVQKSGNRYFVRGRYSSPEKSAAGGDYSSAAYFLTLAALTGEITVNGLSGESKQPDSAIIDMLKLYGADVKLTDNAVTVKRGDRRPIDFSCVSHPDLAPVAAVLAAFANGESVIRATSRLRAKESDREQGIIRLLATAGIKAVPHGDELSIYGGNPRGGNFIVAPDHRIVMAASVLACAARGESTINNIESVAKSYPDFFKELKNVGLQR